MSGGFSGSLINNFALFLSYELRVEGCLTLQGQIYKIYVYGFKTGMGGFSGSLIKNLALFFSYELRVEGCLTL